MTTVDRIREQLDRQDGLTAEAMEPLAVEYGAEVAQLNERLSRCAQLLRKGLRSEALQQANIRPNVFDWASELDFLKVEDWRDILQFYAIALPERLNRTVIQQLQEAIVEEQPLEVLLRKHRRFAIGKAPLSWRLKVLRSIARLDATNPVWGEDIETWERERLRQLPGELATARKNADLDECSKLATELTKSKWEVAPPAKLIKEAVVIAKELEFAQNCEELKHVGAEMYDHFCSQEETDCRQSKEQWDRIAEELTAPIPRDIYHVAEPALLWLDELDSENAAEATHESAVLNLERKLEEARSVLEIEQAYVAATSSDHPLEEAQVRRYRAIVNELAIASKRKSRFRIIAIAAAAVLAAVALGLWQWQSFRKQETAAAVASLSQLLEAGKLGEAQQFCDSLKANKPHLYRTTQIDALVADLEGRKADEAERQATFEQYVMDADNENPALIDLGLLAQAEKLAVSSSEMERVDRLRREKLSYDRAVQDEHFASLKNELASIIAAMDALEQRKFAELGHRDFEQLKDTLAETRLAYPKAGSAGKDLVETIEKRLGSLHTAFRERELKLRASAAALEQLRNTSSLAALRTALTNFKNKLPSSPLAREFEEAAAEYESWNSVNRWNSFLKSVQKLNANKDPAVAAKLQSELRAIQQVIDHPQAAPWLSKADDLLATMAQRPILLSNLQQELEGNWMSALVTVKGQLLDSDGRTVRAFSYEKLIEPKLKQVASTQRGGLLPFELVDGPDGTVARETLRAPFEIIEQPNGVFKSLTDNLALRKKTISSLWEAEFLRLVGSVMSTPQLHPAHQEMIIRSLLDCACDGSPFLARRLEKLQLKLTRRDVAQTPWYDFERPEPATDKFVVNELRTELSQMFREISGAYDSLERISAMKLQWVGFLDRDAGGKISPFLRATNENNGTLLVAYPHAVDNTKTTIKEVGVVTNGLASLYTNSSGFLAGRPLFFESTQQGN